MRLIFFSRAHEVIKAYTLARAYEVTKAYTSARAYEVTKAALLYNIGIFFFLLLVCCGVSLLHSFIAMADRHERGERGSCPPPPHHRNEVQCSFSENRYTKFRCVVLLRGYRMHSVQSSTTRLQDVCARVEVRYSSNKSAARKLI